MKLLSMVILDIPNDLHVSLGEFEQYLSQLKGVERVSVDPVMEKVTVDFNPSKSTIKEIRLAVKYSKRMHKGDKETRSNRSKR